MDHLFTIDALDGEEDYLLGSEEDDLVSGAEFDPGGNYTFAAREILVADEVERSSLSEMYQELGW